MDTGENSAERLDIVPTEDFDDQEKLVNEHDLLGIYVSGHPLDKYEEVMKELSSMTIGQVHEIPGADKRLMRLSGLIQNKKNILDTGQSCQLYWSKFSSCKAMQKYPIINLQTFPRNIVGEI